ncbi:permease prefix domain 1-containing protein [Lacrimispora sp. AGF001]|uniref:permease prefix domain 1-containing protein n=1 Tax=Lacrimispora sp. AGF001 TaxID=3401631 RepID=UPI003B42C50A
MNKNTPESPVSQFLNEVTDQISYEPLRPSIRQELEDHMNDRMEDYKANGLSHSDAEEQALRDMGDAVTIGTELNEAHKIQKAPQLTIISALLLLTGFIFTSFMSWRPLYMASSSLYYIAGATLLIFTVLKGYPFLIRYRKKIALFTGFLYLVQIPFFIMTLVKGIQYGIPSTTYFATILFVPVITVLLYFSRHNKKKFLTIAVICTTVWMLFMYTVNPFLGNTAEIIFLLSALGTVCFMIHRGILTGKKKYLYPVTLAFFVFIGSPLFLSESGRHTMEAFLSPQSSVNRTLDDTYNGVLIQELLSRTPLTHGLKLTPEEMMDYGTGAWYFTSRDPENIDIDVTGIKTSEQQAGINRQLEDVSLWDILPQHYYNNYMIAVFIFLFGWIPGLVLIGAIVLFYLMLFTYSLRINGQLASVLAFGCSQCLLWQGVLYLLGNFGHQYASFPNLPLVSEGQRSIICNAILLGLIFSAYRHDHVMEEPVNYKPVTSG